MLFIDNKIHIKYTNKHSLGRKGVPIEKRSTGNILNERMNEGGCQNDNVLVDYTAWKV